MAIDPLPGQDTLIEFRGKLPDDLTPDELATLNRAIEILFSGTTRAVDESLSLPRRTPQATVLRVQYGSDLFVVCAGIAAVAGAIKLITGSVKDIVDVTLSVRAAKAKENEKASQSQTRRSDELYTAREHRLEEIVTSAGRDRERVTRRVIDQIERTGAEEDAGPRGGRRVSDDEAARHVAMQAITIPDDYEGRYSSSIVAAIILASFDVEVEITEFVPTGGPSEAHTHAAETRDEADEDEAAASRKGADGDEGTAAMEA